MDKRLRFLYNDSVISWSLEAKGLPKGQPVKAGKILVPYNTKMEPETKALLAALVQVQRLEGQRELIERMLKTYGTKYPADMAKAKEVMALLGVTE